jgi:hypothetical protein
MFENEALVCKSFYLHLDLYSVHLRRFGMVFSIEISFFLLFIQPVGLGFLHFFSFHFSIEISHSDLLLFDFCWKTKADDFDIAY